MIILNQFLVIIKDAIIKKKVIVKIPLKIFILNILWVLYKNGYISGYKIKEKIIEVQLKYIGEKNVIGVLTQVSLISKRIYIKNKNLNKKISLYNVGILTKSSGVFIINKNNLNKRIASGEILIKFK